MYTCVLPLPRQEEAMKIAGIDVHKKVLMVVVVDARAPEEKPARRRFVTLPSELQRFRIWLQEQGVEEAVMESTAQYWRSVWLELEPQMRLHLAQAFSNRAPRGRKHDFKDAERLARRLIADELILSFVPGWGTADVAQPDPHEGAAYARPSTTAEPDGVSARRNAHQAVDRGQQLTGCQWAGHSAGFGTRRERSQAVGRARDERLHCTEEQLVDALTGRVQAMPRGMLALQLQRLQLIDQQMTQLNPMIAQAMKSHPDVVIRLAEVPGLGVDSAQQIIAEVGAQASTFSSAAELTAWVEPVLAKKKARSRTTAVAVRKAINTCVEC